MWADQPHTPNGIHAHLVLNRGVIFFFDNILRMEDATWSRMNWAMIFRGNGACAKLEEADDLLA